jgi:hypothetical protein
MGLEKVDPEKFYIDLWHDLDLQVSGDSNNDKPEIFTRMRNIKIVIKKCHGHI